MVFDWYGMQRGQARPLASIFSRLALPPLVGVLRDGRNVFGALHEEGAKEEGQREKGAVASDTPLFDDIEASAKTCTMK